MDVPHGSSVRLLDVEQEFRNRGPDGIGYALSWGGSWANRDGLLAGNQSAFGSLTIHRHNIPNCHDKPEILNRCGGSEVWIGCKLRGIEKVAGIGHDVL